MPRLITLPRIADDRGCLSVAERLSFEIKRVYWLYDISAEATRGGHAHKTLQRLLVAISGSFIAEVNGEPIRLYKPYRGLYVGPMEWLDLHDFSGGAVCMVLASAEYSEDDYIREKSVWTTLKS